MAGLVDADHLIIAELPACTGSTNRAAFADLDELDAASLIAAGVGFAIAVLGATGVAGDALSCGSVATLGRWAVCVGCAGRWGIGDADTCGGVATLGRWAVCIGSAGRLQGDALTLAADLVVGAVGILATNDAGAVDTAQVVGAVGVLGAGIGTGDAAMVEAKVAGGAVAVFVAAAVSASLLEGDTFSFGASVVVARFLTKRSACSFGAQQAALAGRTAGVTPTQ